MMEKKLLTREEQSLNWLKSELEKDQKELDSKKLKLINEIKTFEKQDLLPKTKKLTLWKKIKKVILGS